MKRIVLLALSLCLSAVILAGSVNAAVSNPFADVKEGAFYYEPVLWAVENGVTTGVSATRFDVASDCTRSQVVTFLWRAAGCPEPGDTRMVFEDVRDTRAFYYKPVLWALEQGIVTGEEPLFGPTVKTTRAEFVDMLWRAEGKPSHAVYNPFRDVSLRHACYDAIIWAYETEVTNGVGDNRFAPNTTCTRSQIVTFLWRYYANRPDHGETKPEQEPLPAWVNAADYGLSPDNDGLTNSRVLQSLVNRMSKTGGQIHIPAGTYYFAELSRQSIGSHCVEMQSNVWLSGDGADTVLKPIGQSQKGLDMFYWNDFADKGVPNYLENCRFEDFVIDSSETCCLQYTSAGKGFMFNLFRNCHWDNVTVKYTDGTGFGVDCPIDSSITNCVAIGCGKGATTAHGGASGFGIGFGYSQEENLVIANCQAYDNKKFGFFFEDQKRFGNIYGSSGAAGFVVRDCYASGNYCNFGGIVAVDTLYENCESENALLYGYLLENCARCTVRDCTSRDEEDTAFVILQTDLDRYHYPVVENTYENCVSTGSRYGAKVFTYGASEPMADNAVVGCIFNSPAAYAVYTAGSMQSLTLTGNTGDNTRASLQASIGDFVNTGNSWNWEPTPH